MVTCGLVGLFMAVWNLALIEIGKHEYGSTAVGSSMGLVAFVLMLVASAYHSRSETEGVFTVSTFDSAKMNWIALAEILGAIGITQLDFLRRLLGTVQLNAPQWGFALLATFSLILTWELGKWIARRVIAGEAKAVPGAAAPAA
jgi:magnesium-transporting ATPase (P-type)